MFDEANQIDGEVKAQISEAIKTIPIGRWEDRTFYGIEEHLKEAVKEEPIPEVKEEQAQE